MPTLDHGYEENRLTVEHVLDKPHAMDWTVKCEDPDDRPWEWAEVVTCPRCLADVVAVNGTMVDHDRTPEYTDGDGNDHDADECPGSGDGHDSAEGPMMSYWYPATFPGDMEDAARLIGSLPLCAVTVDGKEGLALTGGGMDLSWEICDAFVRLGCLPPYHFASDLPLMGSRPLSERTLRVLEACDRSIAILAGWTENARERQVTLRRRMSECTMGPANPSVIEAEINFAMTIADMWDRDPDADGVHQIIDGTDRTDRLAEYAADGNVRQRPDLAAMLAEIGGGK